MELSEIFAMLDSSTVRIVCDINESRDCGEVFWLGEDTPWEMAHPDSLCFCRASRLNDMQPELIAGRAFAVFVDQPAKRTNRCAMMLFESESSLRAFYERVASELRSVKDAAARVLGLASLVNAGVGLRRIANEVSSIFDAPVTVLDRSLSFLATSDDIPFSIADGEERASGVIPERARIKLKDEGLLSTARGSVEDSESAGAKMTAKARNILKGKGFADMNRDPDDDVRVFSWETDSGTTLFNHFAFIKIDDTIVGSLSVFSRDAPLPKSRIDLLPAVSHMMSLEMQKDDAYLLNRSAYYSHLLTQLFDGTLPYQDNVALARRFALFGYEMRHFIRIAYVDLSYEYHDPAQIETIARQIGQTAHNAIYVVKEEAVVLFMTLDVFDDRDVNVEDHLGFIARKNGARIGISSIFTDASRAPEYLAEAKRALATGMRMNPARYVTAFDNVRMFDLFSQVRNKSELNSYRYPPLMMLASYDERHGTHLVRTLYVWLQDVAHPMKTCEELFIHKNTLYYRIDKIREVMGVDPKDPLVFTQIQLTFLILEYQGEFDGMVTEKDEA